MAYESTQVSTAKTWTEINAMLYEHQCQATRYAEKPDEGFVIEFVRSTKEGRSILVSIPVFYPLRNRPTKYSDKQWDQAKRTMWRSAYYWLKAMFDAIDKNIIPFEEAFLADIVVQLPSGQSGRVKNIMLADVLAAKQCTLGLDEPRVEYRRLE